VQPEYDDPRVLVVNQAFARRHWESERGAVGRQVKLGFGDGPPWTIVGVAGDARDQGLFRPVDPRAYVLFTQFPDNGPVAILLQTGTRDPAALAKPLAEAVRSIDPDQPVHSVMPLEAFVGAKFARQRRIAAMLTVFACLTLALACIGVHGLLSYAVRLRTREIAIRRALGSGDRPIVMLVLRRAGWLLGLGMGIALPIALVLQWYLANVLGVAPEQGPLLMAAAMWAVSIAGVAASIASTRRAIRVVPTTVLRAE
jgi:hypothetical protein